MSTTVRPQLPQRAAVLELAAHCSESVTRVGIAASGVLAARHSQLGREPRLTADSDSASWVVASFAVAVAKPSTAGWSDSISPSVLLSHTVAGSVGTS